MKGFINFNFKLMTTEITINNIKVPTTREEVSDRKNIDKLLESIKDLGNIVLDFSTPESIKESKKFRSDSNKFIKEFKEFCDPLEEEGRTVAKTRSEVKLTLEKIVDTKLNPILERENKLKAIKDKLFIPSSDVNSCNAKLAELKALDDYDWFGLKDEALPVINQSKTFLENELLGFEKAAKEKAEAEEKARLENEQRIRDEATAKAKADAQKAIDEANQRAEQAEAKIIPVVEVKEALKPAPVNLTKIHQAKIHNEILEDLLKYFDKINEDQAKDIIRLFASGKIRNLKIIY